MKQKILFFLVNGASGAERMTVTISNYFDASLFDIKYVLVQKGNDSIRKFIKPGLEVMSIPCRRVYFSTFPILRVLVKERPDIVFCSSPAISSRLIVASKLVGIKRIIIRSSNMFNFERKDVQLLMKVTYPLADRIIFQQDEMKNDFVSHIPSIKNKAITLLNPLDINSIKKGAEESNPFHSAPNQINYIWVARFAHEKAQDVLVKAFDIVHRKMPNTHLWFIGRHHVAGDSTQESEMYRIVKTFVERNDITEFVHFVGHDSNPYRWMKFCDCFVLPSRREGLPNVMLEAMYLNKPVVAARCLKIISEIVNEGVNGYTCEVDSPKEMAELMMKALSLKDCKMNYKPASEQDFIDAFFN